jgi:two-component system response regulator CpxR
MSTSLGRRILIAEDDQEVSRLMVQNLKRSGIEADQIFDGLDVVPRIMSDQYDLLILDLMLPKKHGLSVLQDLRKVSSIPVLILSAMSDEKNRIAGLELGANDYVVKPYFAREVVIRIQNLLKLHTINQVIEANVIESGILIADLRTKVLIVNEDEIDLTDMEFDVLVSLIRHSGEVVDRTTLARIMFGNVLPSSNRNIDMKISQIRKKLGHYDSMIRTVWGGGYEFVPIQKS